MPDHQITLDPTGHKIPSEMEVAPLKIELFSRFIYKNIKMHPGFLSVTIKLLKCA